jgi:Nucleoside H+ symporter
LDILALTALMLTPNLFVISPAANAGCLQLLHLLPYKCATQVKPESVSKAGLIKKNIINSMKSTTRVQLSVMMFLQFVVWGAWYGQLSKYLFAIGFDGSQV